ncbi:hypothetical protein B0H10DRAFT_2052313 [Mycena sp. CBHHK59/15]|nr:hypothetical protein B0H10DRAFT_2052313 [Mycena sp. CBHHK59/15]
MCCCSGRSRCSTGRRGSRCLLIRPTRGAQSDYQHHAIGWAVRGQVSEEWREFTCTRRRRKEPVIVFAIWSRHEAAAFPMVLRPLSHFIVLDLTCMNGDVERAFNWEGVFKVWNTLARVNAR